MNYLGLLSAASIGVAWNWQLYRRLSWSYYSEGLMVLGMTKLGLQISALTAASYVNGALSLSNVIDNCAILLASHMAFHAITHVIGRDRYMKFTHKDTRKDIVVNDGVRYAYAISGLGALIDGVGPIAVAALATFATDKCMNR